MRADDSLFLSSCLPDSILPPIVVQPLRYGSIRRSSTLGATFKISETIRNASVTLECGGKRSALAPLTLVPRRRRTVCPIQCRFQWTGGGSLSRSGHRSTAHGSQHPIITTARNSGQANIHPIFVFSSMRCLADIEGERRVIFSRSPLSVRLPRSRRRSIPSRCQRC